MKTEALTQEYNNWLKENNLPEMSADELVLEVDDSDQYIATAEQRAWLYNFINRWEKAEESDRPAQRFYHSEETGTLYFLEEDRLMGVEAYEGLYDMGGVFQIEEWNEQLAEEDITSNRPITLGEIWAEARKALTK